MPLFTFFFSFCFLSFFSEGGRTVRGLGENAVVSGNNPLGIRQSGANERRRKGQCGGDPIQLRPNRRPKVSLATCFLMRSTCGTERPNLGAAESDAAEYREPREGGTRSHKDDNVHGPLQDVGDPEVSTAPNLLHLRPFAVSYPRTPI